MWVVEIGLISVCGIEPDLIAVKGSGLTYFLCAGRRSLGFSDHRISLRGWSKST